MRTFWSRSITIGASAILAFVMLAINVGFEAAGSVPDFVYCGYLAGNLALLVLFYPLAAACVSFKAVEALLNTSPSSFVWAARIGGRIGLLGSSVYLVGGGLTACLRTSGEFPPPLACAVMAIYVTLCAGAGRIGGDAARRKAMAVAYTAAER